MNKIIIVTLLVATICFVGCKEDTSTNSMSANIPVVANTTNAFAFTLVANSYTSNAEYNLSFSTDSLSGSIMISNQTSGNASLTILDSNNSIVYSDSLLSNKVVAFTQASKGIPKIIKLAFSSYTGTLIFALSRNNSNTGQIVFPASGVSYNKYVQPLFNIACNYSGCHDAADAGGLDLTSYISMMSSSPAPVQAGDTTHSILIQRVEGKGSIMPPAGFGSLTSNQIQGLKTWTMEGAKDN
jgi:hypothetical protein